MECHANNYNKIGGSNDQVSKLKLLMPITLITIQHKAKPPNLIAACEQTVHLIIIVSIFWVHRAAQFDIQDIGCDADHTWTWRFIRGTCEVDVVWLEEHITVEKGWHLVVGLFPLQNVQVAGAATQFVRFGAVVELRG
jgi:hypothetical protein